MASKLDVMEWQKWTLQKSKYGVSVADIEELVSDKTRNDRNKLRDHISDLEKLISTKATKVKF